MILLTALSLLTAHAVPPEPGRSALLMSRLAQSLNPAAKAVSDAQYEPLADAAIDAAVRHLRPGIAAALGAALDCEDDLLPAAVRAGPDARRRSYAQLYRRFMHRYAETLVRYRAEFLAQRSIPPTERGTARLRELAYELAELARRAHRELKAHAAAP